MSDDEYRRELRDVRCGRNMVDCIATEKRVAELEAKSARQTKSFEAQWFLHNEATEKREALIEQQAAEIAALREQVARMPVWVSVHNRLPNPEEHQRVLIYTHGYDFGGQCVFDVQAELLNECYYPDDDEQPEIYQHASHWTPLPDIIDPPAAGGEVMRSKGRCGRHDVYRCEFCQQFHSHDYHNKEKGE